MVLCSTLWTVLCKYSFTLGVHLQPTVVHTGSRPALNTSGTHVIVGWSNRADSIVFLCLSGYDITGGKALHCDGLSYCSTSHISRHLSLTSC
ncbi:hypothetical protein PF007_g30197 [Phytophthora fragariae]|uniref:Secreted protein n=1 Tax=Phytophthora fragariae TaxID=53985 RepID=A0A6A3PPJ9_9STRA|nr:hypothetical protein PF003_g23645 [Phytophthora fragariae]KAE8915265.1 hypothetical protein PF003_g1103 [Phytophthora fragariae]KAE9061604.1 hypothetical protein PF007_g30197 [Phytophthora fragariae]